MTLPTDPATAERSRSLESSSGASPGPLEALETSADPSPFVAAPTLPPAPPPPAEPRQRWRLTFSREAVAADQVGRAALDAWQESLVRSGLPVAAIDPSGVRRARIAFAAPLPAAARGEAELVDVWLTERCPVWAVREALADRLPAAHRWIDAEDVWLGEPALAARVAAADWRIELVGQGLDRARIAGAAGQMIAARSLPRTRVKGTSEKRYDLRPLLDEIIVDGEERAAAPSGLDSPPPEPGDRFIVRVRTRFDPELGAGRPEEVVAALAESAGVALDVASLVRVRLLIGGSATAPARSRTGGPGRFGGPPGST